MKRKLQNGPSFQAYTWGLSDSGQLGHGDTRSQSQPTLIESSKGDTTDESGSSRATGSLNEWKQIACGGNHTVGITATGNLCSWGNGDHGQLGHNNTDSIHQPKRISEGLFCKQVERVECGFNHTVVLTTKGAVYTCGRGSAGQLGHGSDYMHDLVTFKKISGLASCVQVAAGDDHTVLLTSEGRVISFGNNENGRTGHGTSEGYEPRPRKVKGCLEGKKVVYVATGNAHTVCIDEDGEVYTWGFGQNGRLGHGNEKSLALPKLVDGLAGKRCSSVACGGSHTLVLAQNGKVFSFGDNSHGQLGHGDTKKKMTPKLIKVPFEGKKIQQVACGRFHSLALTTKGGLYSWGCGENGRLGHGSGEQYRFPSVVESLSGDYIVSIDSHFCHSTALVRKSYPLKVKKTMVDDESCSDLVFVLKDDNDERVHAIRGILIGKSEYFRTMFRNDMKESRENIIEIKDCSKELLLLFLEYIYTGSVDLGDDLENAVELYALSHRYLEDELSEICVKVIKEKLNGKTSVTLLEKVHIMGESVDVVKDICMKYVLSNYKRLLKNKELRGSLPSSLRLELFDKICES